MRTKIINFDEDTLLFLNGLGIGEGSKFVRQAVKEKIEREESVENLVTKKEEALKVINKYDIIMKERNKKLELCKTQYKLTPDEFTFLFQLRYCSIQEAELYCASFNKKFNKDLKRSEFLILLNKIK